MYDKYTVFITLPADVDIQEVLKAGMEALGMEPDETMETEWEDSYEV